MANKKPDQRKVTVEEQPNNNSPEKQQQCVDKNEILEFCPKCEYRTNRKNNLDRHWKAIHEPLEKNIDCCNLSFSTKGDLNEHQKTAHVNGYKCLVCYKNFSRKAQLTRHDGVHTQERRFECTIGNCTYRCNNVSNLQRHKQKTAHQDTKINEKSRKNKNTEKVKKVSQRVHVSVERSSVAAPSTVTSHSELNDLAMLADVSVQRLDVERSLLLSSSTGDFSSSTVTRLPSTSAVEVSSIPPPGSALLSKFISAAAPSLIGRGSLFSPVGSSSSTFTKKFPSFLIAEAPSVSRPGSSMSSWSIGSVTSGYSTGSFLSHSSAYYCQQSRINEQEILKNQGKNKYWRYRHNRSTNRNADVNKMAESTQSASSLYQPQPTTSSSLLPICENQLGLNMNRGINMRTHSNYRNLQVQPNILRPTAVYPTNCPLYNHDIQETPLDLSCRKS